MAIFVFGCIRRKGDKSKNGGAKTIRYILSNLRFPGFWGASVRGENANKEKSKDLCAIIVFCVWLIGLALLFLGLLGSCVTKWDPYLHNKVQLLNGVIPFKPEFPSSFNKSYIIVDYDGISEAYGKVVDNADLIEGPVLEDHGIHTAVALRETFAPGSVVSLNVTASKNTRIFYERNNTVLMDNELVPSFELSFTETGFTSYFINISCPDYYSPFSYDFVAKTMTYNMTGSKRVFYGEDYTKFEISKGQVFLLSHQSEYDDKDTFDIKLYSVLADVENAWSWTSSLLIGFVLLVEEAFIVCLVGAHSGSFAEKTSSGRNSRCRILGHINILLVILAVITIFSCGSVFFQRELLVTDELFYTRTVLYTGEQIIVPLNSSEDQALSFFCNTSDVKVSAIREIPDAPSTKSINCTPDAFMFNRTWSANYYIVEGYSLEWDIETTVPIVLAMTNSNGETVHYEENETVSSNEFTAKSTDVYTLWVNETTSGDALLSFRSMILEAPIYDFSNVTLWSMHESFDRKELGPEVKGIAIETVKPNLTSNTVVSAEIDHLYDQPALLAGYNATLAFIVIFIVLFLLAVVFMVFDLLGVKLSFCYICSSSDDAETGSKNQSEDTNLLPHNHNLSQCDL